MKSMVSYLIVDNINSHTTCWPLKLQSLTNYPKDEPQTFLPFLNKYSGLEYVFSPRL